MAAARVLVSDDLSPEAVQVLREAGLEVDVRVGLSPAALEEIVGGYDALAVRSATKVTARLLEKATRLRVIGRAGVGVDNVDLDAATRRGVVVMNTPGGSSITVAELALSMILALSRHVPAATASVKAGRWEKKRFQGHEVAGKTLGVVGIGNIGSVLVDRALALKMRVIAYDPFISAEAAAKLGVSLVELDELWRTADVVSLHVPLTEQTRNLVDAKVLARMKKGALLVNCARGGIVDERALADALASGQLGGAALDVFEQEPPPADHPLLGLDGFVATPHIGASTEEAQSAVAVAVAEQLAAYLLHGVVKNAVNVPGLPREVLDQLAPYLPLAEKLGSLAAQLAGAGAGRGHRRGGGRAGLGPDAPDRGARAGRAAPRLPGDAGERRERAGHREGPRHRRAGGPLRRAARLRQPGDGHRARAGRRGAGLGHRLREARRAHRRGGRLPGRGGAGGARHRLRERRRARRGGEPRHHARRRGREHRAHLAVPAGGPLAGVRLPERRLGARPRAPRAGAPAAARPGGPGPPPLGRSTGRLCQRSSHRLSRSGRVPILGARGDLPARRGTT